MSADDYLLNTYARYPVEFVYGRGAYLYDAEGQDYLDFLSGIAVCNFGHQHPFITERTAAQLHRLWHTSNLFLSGGQAVLAKQLCERAGCAFAFFSNSGTEANEAAIKLARKWGAGRYHIITAEGGFHGRSMGSLSATAQPKFWKGFFPMLEGFSSVPFGDTDAAENAIRLETVAIMIEPIQGESGIRFPPEDYLRSLRTICDRHDLLLIMDEVQTGMGRTGKYFAHQWSSIQPDIITLAKGIANGLPLGATLCSHKVGAVIQPSDHGSTFGGNPVAVAAAVAVQELLTEEILDENSMNGKRIQDGLSELSIPGIQEIRGSGLMIGVELEPGISAKAVARKLLADHVVVGTSGESVLRLLPPFVITEKEIDRFLDSIYLTLCEQERVPA
jgi:predicted acetylornithine/succinylornithine family transaminase